MKKFGKINIFACAALTAALCMSSAVLAAGEQDIEEVYPAEEAAQVSEASEPMPAENAVAVSPPYNPDTDSLPQTNSNASSNSRSDNPFEGLPMGTGNVEDLYKYWETNGYPDYVSYAGEFGVASYNAETQTETVYNQWTIGVVNITEAQKQEILSLVSSDYYVSFKAANYSHAYREEKAEEIKQRYPYAITELSEASENIYVYNNGYTEADWMEMAKAFEEGIVINGGDYSTADQGAGIPEIGILEEEGEEIIPATKAPSEGIDGAAPTAGNDSAAPSDGTAPKVNEGDEIAIMSIEDNGETPAPPIGGDVDAAPAVNDKNGGTGGNAEIAPEAGEANGYSGNQEAAMLPAVQKKADPIYMWIFISGVSIIAVATAAFVILHRAKKNALVTTAGNTVSLSSNPTKAEIVNALKNSETKPNDSSFQKIMEKINE